MRSRYSAYVMQDQSYLLASWHPSTRPPSISFDSNQRWLGLKVKKTVAGLQHDNRGEVAFVARFKIDGKGHRLQEHSRFIKENGGWFYVDGDLV